MSESTFAQPTSPTQGLANYDLERGAKELYPAPIPGRGRKRQAAWRKRFQARGHMRKGIPTMQTTIDPMVGMLSTSVAKIISTHADPAQRDEMLSKSFTEFKAALLGEVNALAKAAPQAEEPLFKGLGCVGRIANLVSTLANQMQTIMAGKERYQSDSDPADPASEEIAVHLEDLLAHAEAILRIAVNEHCEPMDDGDNAHDMHVVMVPLSGGGDVAVKTHLPTDLAKFATDPDDIDRMLAQVGFSALGAAGHDAEALSKALESGDLAKFSPDQSMMGGDPSEDPAAAALPGSDDQDPLDVAMRICSLLMIQLDYIKQSVDGGAANDPTGEEATADGTDPTAGNAAAAAGADAGDGSGPSPDDVTKVAPAGDLQKFLAIDDATLAKVLAAKGLNMEALTKLATQNEELTTRLEEFQTLVPELLAKAEPPKAMLVVSGATVVKGQEEALGEGVEKPQDLSKLTPEERLMALTKRAQKSGKPHIPEPSASGPR